MPLLKPESSPESEGSKWACTRSVINADKKTSRQPHSHALLASLARPTPGKLEKQVAWWPLRKLDSKKKESPAAHSIDSPPATAPSSGDRLQCAAEKGSTAIADIAAVCQTTPSPEGGGDGERRTCIDSDPDQDVLHRGDTIPLLADSRDDAAVKPTGGSSGPGGHEKDEWNEGMERDGVQEDELRRPLIQRSPGPAWG